ncbi:MAG: DTW domain-containing protein [Kofleriaceae bacterium]|nr:DTW domain-containing protein [Kofleriaceae bacterium]MCL4226291.1 DTW domain-containing protein [Myxococcales bacterium]
MCYTPLPVSVPPGRCPRCLFRLEHCLCPAVPRLETATRVILLRHHTERLRASNSGRLVHLALAGSVLRDVSGPERRGLDLELGPDTWLVYPEGEPWSAPPAPRPRALVFLDATWHQARRMRQRLPALRGLPVLALATTGGAARMRKAPRPEQVSTIEAVAAALRLLEGGDVPDALEALFAAAVTRMRETGRGNVTGEG